MDIQEVTAHATSFPEWLSRFRVECLQQTQEQFASTMDVSLSAVYRWEAGERLPSGPTIQLLSRMARDRSWHAPPDVDRPHRPRVRSTRRS